MKATILAAGIGSRLRPITIDRPKCCVTVGGVPILERQLHGYADATVVDEVVVVVGYLADQVRSLCERVDADLPDLSITVVENERYANTDNMYSLYAAREHLAGEPFFLSNGDVVCEPAVFRSLSADAEGSAIACDAGRFDEESMKVTTDADGRIDHIGKAVDASDAHAVSLDAYRFSAACSRRLFDRIRRTIEVEESFDRWTELAIDDLLGEPDHDFVPVDVPDAAWVEVDDAADLLAADRTFAPMEPLAAKDAVFFDLDGTIYVDDDPVEGAAALVAELRATGTDVFFLSNNSSAWKTTYVDRLATMDVPADPDHVILSTDAVIAHLRQTGVDDAFVLGTEAMRDAIRAAGVDPVADDPEVVVVGFDTELTYEKVRRASLAVRDGATFLQAHPDLVCPTESGLAPDCGSIAALVEAATGREPDRVFGKPDPAMVREVLDERGLDPADVAVVGDRLETEVAMAESLGCESVCVLTGEADRLAVERSDVTPTLIAPNVGALRRPERPADASEGASVASNAPQTD